VVTGVKATAPTYNSAKITWAKTPGADGYKVYRADKKAGPWPVEGIDIPGGGTTSYTENKLKTGKTYYYKVCAYQKVSGVDEKGSDSKVLAVTPSLAKPTFSLAAKKKAIKISWKATPGANGYVIYQSTKKSGKYKKVATKKSGKAASFTSKKLKAKTTYYYKIQAYRTVDGKKVYSPFSAIKSKKTK
jgi:fibronectin type 3 domain-containing protein